jgi:hypothetical protein
MDPLPEKIFYIPLPRLDLARLKDVPERLPLAHRLQAALRGCSAAFVRCQRATWRARLWWTERRLDAAAGAIALGAAVGLALIAARVV